MSRWKKRGSDLRIQVCSDVVIVRVRIVALIGKIKAQSPNVF